MKVYVVYKIQRETYSPMIDIIGVFDEKTFKKMTFEEYEHKGHIVFANEFDLNKEENVNIW